MEKTALLLIDIQNIYFTKGPYLLFNPETATMNAQKVLNKFRENNRPIIYIKHDFNTVGYSESSEYLNEINDLVKPLDTEKVIHKKLPNSFYQTELHDYLVSQEIDNLVVVGMMSHMCIDTTVRACKDFNYNVSVIEDACTTKDLSCKGKTIDATTIHNTYMAGLSGMFATIYSTDDFLTLFC
jgi:nicotinamidase-related amidase